MNDTNRRHNPSTLITVERLCLGIKLKKKKEKNGEIISNQTRLHVNCHLTPRKFS